MSQRTDNTQRTQLSLYFADNIYKLFKNSVRLNWKQWRSRSAGCCRSHLIRIHTIFYTTLHCELIHTNSKFDRYLFFRWFVKYIKIENILRILTQHRKAGKCPDMAKELLAGTQNNKTNKKYESWYLKKKSHNQVKFRYIGFRLVFF